MSRRRQTPWIHRYSRIILAAIAGLGVLNTGYLAITKLFGGETTCPTSGCEQVLSSGYAYVFGLPLSLFGFAAYLSMVGFALAPLIVKPETNKSLHTTLDSWTWRFLFAGSSAMMVFSFYLMYVMATEFVAKYGPQGLCYYCVGSAITATALFVVTLLGRTWDDFGQLFFTGVIVAVVVLVGSLGIYADVNGTGSSALAESGQAGPPITTTSGQAETALARHLRDTGAKMYGAYWCPHCHDQKQLFGNPAVSDILYVECAADGRNPQPDLCRAANVQGFPSWQIDGQLYAGTQPLQELARLSGYQGSTDFQN